MSVNGASGELLHFSRPFKWFRKGCCCFLSHDCCFQTLKVFTGKATAEPEKALGYVKEDYSFLRPYFSVYNHNDDRVFEIIGEICYCTTHHFKIFDRRDGKTKEDKEEPIGEITKVWSGFGKELFTDATNFVVTFPTSATVHERALLFGALFLIDFLYFERGSESSI